MVCYAIYQGFGRMNARWRELDSANSSPLADQDAVLLLHLQSLCVCVLTRVGSSFCSFCDRRSLVRVALWQSPEELMWLCSCYKTKIISLRLLLHLLCAPSEIDAGCFIFIVLCLCSFVLLGYLVMGVGVDLIYWIVTTTTPDTHELQQHLLLC